MKDSTNIHPLNSFKGGEGGAIVAVQGDKEFQQRLISMGLHVGCEIQVLHHAKNGNPMLIVCHETRLALGQDMAAQILVAPLANTASSWRQRKNRLLHRCKHAWAGNDDEKNMFRRFRWRSRGKNCRLHKK